MQLDQVMQELEAVGNAQNRKIWGRHGVRGPMFGVSYANLNALRKQIKRDHGLAQELWNTGNHDARVLATMIADPRQTTPELLTAWVDAVDNYIIADAVSTVANAASTPDAMMTHWIESEHEWHGRVGWLMVAYRAMNESELPDSVFERQLITIEREIHQRPNYTRDAMNSALIAIGARNAALQAQAIAAARRIGTVEVDHGQTNCKTPAAEPYILKMVERHHAKQARSAKR